MCPVTLPKAGPVSRRLVERPRPLEVQDCGSLCLSRLAGCPGHRTFYLRVAAEPVLPVPGRRLAADFLAALRPVAAVDRLPRAERFAFPRLVVVLARLAAAFFVVFLRLRGFSVPPLTASITVVAALDTPSMAASTPVLAA
jgi:hypothetical protein